jgi:hypothetical protein
MFDPELKELLFINFLKVEELVAEKEKPVDAVTFMVLGHVAYFVNNIEFTIPLALWSKENESHTNASIVRLVNDDKLIILNRSFFTDALVSELYGSIAHELGHLIGGHLDPATDKSKIIFTVNGKEILAAADLYKGDPSDENYDAYMRNLFEGLMAGGTNGVELEADILALKLVPLEWLILCHSGDLRNCENPYTSLEKANRITHLLKLHKGKDALIPCQIPQIKIVLKDGEV